MGLRFWAFQSLRVCPLTAVNMTPNTDCYTVVAVANLWASGLVASRKVRIVLDRLRL